MQDVPDGQTRTAVVFLAVASKQRSLGKRLNAESPHVTLLQGREQTVFWSGLAHGRERKTNNIDLREVFDHELDPAAVVG
ncbi:hypothetical protein ES703_82354 [subsurface metagenome]